MIDYTLPLEQLPDPLPIVRLTRPFDVTITPPGSKSITCRAYVLAALAEGESKIIRPLRADDTDHLLNALCTLGAEARWVKSDEHDGDDVYIKGVNGRFPKGGNLYMGEGGTPTRFMIACACLAKEPVTIDASSRMRERPIAEGVDMLRQLGAKIEYVEAEGRLPVRVVPSEAFRGGELKIGETASSQFISSIMLVAPFLSNGVALAFSDEREITSASYFWMTYKTMRAWHINVGSHGKHDVFHRILPNRVEPQEQIIEPDASSACFWLAASAIYAGARSTIPHIHPTRSLQGDAALVLSLHKMSRLSAAERNQLLTDNQLKHYGSSMRGVHFEMRLMPDAAMSLAVVAAVAKGASRLTGLRTLRVKETDRIAALANELRKVGCTVATGEDWIEITPPVKSTSKPVDAASDDRREEDGGGATGGVALPPSSSPMMASSKPSGKGGSSDAASLSNHIIIETYNDHRMAMAFAVLGLNPPNGIPLAIRNPKCVAKSYPTFWKDFASLYR